MHKKNYFHWNMKGKGSLTTWNNKGKIDVSSKASSLGVSSGGRGKPRMFLYKLLETLRLPYMANG